MTDSNGSLICREMCRLLKVCEQAIHKNRGDQCPLGEKAFAGPAIGERREQSLHHNNVQYATSFAIETAKSRVW